jgi:uroporphyrinogen-III decarboxylase
MNTSNSGMNERERILSVFKGAVPDRVPLMLDLSHWFYHRTGRTWDVSSAYTEPEYDLIDAHKHYGVGFYLPNLARFYQVRYPESVTETVSNSVDVSGAKTITWSIKTNKGEISRERKWNEKNYSWGVSRYGIEEERDLEIFIEAMESRTFKPIWDNYHAWDEAVGDMGVVYLPLPYSGVGMLMNNWMGIEGFIYGAADMPDLLKEAVDRYNANLLDLADVVCKSPAHCIFISDNFSSDVQPPHFFEEWSKAFYAELAEKVHKAGKSLVVHIDGKLRGAIDMLKRVGVDAGDAITPTPMGDLSPQQCRDEAGPDFILSGGIAPNLWLETSPERPFIDKVKEWLELRKQSPRLILAAGDQVPIGTPESRIRLIKELVEEFGRY